MRLGQVRLFLQAPKSEAEAIYRSLETALEDDGFPLAIFEVDEASGLHEVSVYSDADYATV